MAIALAMSSGLEIWYFILVILVITWWDHPTDFVWKMVLGATLFHHVGYYPFHLSKFNWKKVSTYENMLVDIQFLGRFFFRNDVLVI